MKMRLPVVLAAAALSVVAVAAGASASVSAPAPAEPAVVTSQTSADNTGKDGAVVPPECLSSEKGAGTGQAFTDTVKC
ncbi:hypothetical protein [Kitasatospora purpeofusca]|uniref:Secreted protein n=1 Tax=Kitasatospora purpeofusca TaxID=67352 RepID=A0ABZ1TUM0_9ACTN|nr:hypothetical protein [Kitasatospora purpeofusca]